MRSFSSCFLWPALFCGFTTALPATLSAQQVAEIHVIGNGGNTAAPGDRGGTETGADEDAAKEKIAKQSGPSGECDKLTEPKELRDPKAGLEREFIDWDHAVAICKQALEAHPDDPHFHLTLGIALGHVKRYAEANNHYKIAADANIAAAQNALGYNYHRGFGVVKDDQKAFELWSKAAAAGWPSAMGNLASAYGDGIYVQKDPAKSLDWSEKAIEAGNALSLSVIGNAYINGNGVPRDFATAAQYFQQGADLGDGFALKSLANMYEAGFMGGPQLQMASDLRLRAVRLDPDSPDPGPITVFKQILDSTRAHPPAKVHRVVRRYVYFRRYRFFGCGFLWC